MPHDPLEVHAGAGLAGAEVLGLREGRGVGDGPGINLEKETIRKLNVMMMKYNSIAPLIKYLIW